MPIDAQTIEGGGFRGEGDPEDQDPTRPASLHGWQPLLIDPRLGDAEDDIASTKSRSLVAIGGRLLAEISLPKLLLAWIMLIGLPAILLGLAPLVVLGWATTIPGRVATALAGFWSLLIAVGLVALAWFGGRPVLRVAEQSFWSLNALAIQPIYALFREGLRHIGVKLAPDLGPRRRTQLYARPRSEAASW